MQLQGFPILVNVDMAVLDTVLNICHMPSHLLQKIHEIVLVISSYLQVSSTERNVSKVVC